MTATEGNFPVNFLGVIEFWPWPWVPKLNPSVQGRCVSVCRPSWPYWEFPAKFMRSFMAFLGWFYVQVFWVLGLGEPSAGASIKATDVQGRTCKKKQQGSRSDDLTPTTGVWGPGVEGLRACRLQGFEAQTDHRTTAAVGRRCKVRVENMEGHEGCMRRRVNQAQSRNVEEAIQMHCAELPEAGALPSGFKASGHET